MSIWSWNGMAPWNVHALSVRHQAAFFDTPVALGAALAKIRTGGAGLLPATINK